MKTISFTTKQKKVSDIDEGWCFVKVGVTSDPVNRFSRYPNEEQNLKFEIIYLREDNLYNVFTVEQKILKAFKHAKVKPITWFSGGTECLHINYKDLILEYIKKYYYGITKDL